MIVNQVQKCLKEVHIIMHTNSICLSKYYRVSQLLIIAITFKLPFLSKGKTFTVLKKAENITCDKGNFENGSYWRKEVRKTFQNACGN